MLLLAALLLAQVAAPAGTPAAGTPAAPVAVATDAAATPTPVRLAMRAFGDRAEVEVRDLPAAAADTALRQALRRIAEIDAEADLANADGALARLNAAAGQGPQKIGSDLQAILARALDFCTWSDGINGPLGGRLNAAWGVRGVMAGLPTAEALADATESARCGHLTVNDKTGSATLEAGSQIDLWGFAEGYAVDQALAALRQEGAHNAWVRVGPVQRGLGPGPGGSGWWVTLPKVPGATASLEPFAVHDRAVAILQASDRHLGLGGDTWSPYIQQRVGRPAAGVLMVVAVTDLGIDAQALGVTMFTNGSRQGQLRLGSIKPEPSVLWLLGSGQGTPLTADYRWSTLRRR